MIDLHVHTNRSDGGKSIDEIMSLISDGDTISITDHNIIGNYNKIINGIELEVRYKKKRFHFLLLDFDVKKMNNYYKIIRRHDVKKFYKMISKLDVQLDVKKVRGFIKANEYFDKVRLNNLLVLSKFSSNPRDAYYKYTKGIKEGFRKAISIKEAFNLEHKSGGILVLAHPTKYYKNINLVKKFILYLKRKYNLRAVEVINNYSSELEIAVLKEFCLKNNILISAGSDYHAKYGVTENKKIGFVHDFKIKENDVTIIPYLQGIK